MNILRVINICKLKIYILLLFQLSSSIFQLFDFFITNNYCHPLLKEFCNFFGIVNKNHITVETIHFVFKGSNLDTSVL